MVACSIPPRPPTPSSIGILHQPLPVTHPTDAALPPQHGVQSNGCAGIHGHNTALRLHSRLRLHVARATLAASRRRQLPALVQGHGRRHYEGLYVRGAVPQKGRQQRLERHQGRCVAALHGQAVRSGRRVP